MASRHRLFRVLYALRFAPWDGHPLSGRLRALIEGDGTPALPPGRALDVGCGTGDSAIYLAQHGWQVTGVDFVAKALNTARAKSRTAGVAVDFAQADVTQLSNASVGSGFSLIVDNGCLHGMDDDDRAAYAREVTAVSTPDAHLVISAFAPGGSFGVRGITREEVEQRFSSAWRLLSAEPAGDDGRSANSYLLQRI